MTRSARSAAARDPSQGLLSATASAQHVPTDEKRVTVVPKPLERKDGGMVPADVRELMCDARRITVLTGAGMSAESGVPTFRDALTGLWEHVDPGHLATPDAWDTNPGLVYAWYLWRLRLISEVEPNAGHRALADLANRRQVSLVTQNVDDLHERAGSEVLAHLHGSIVEFRCASCARPYPTQTPPRDLEESIAPPMCPACCGLVRPGIVWFGESVPHKQFEMAVAAHTNTDVVLVVGTSGAVYPAAELPVMAKRAGIPVIELDPDDTELSDVATAIWRTTAAVGLPTLVESLVR